MYGEREIRGVIYIMHFSCDARRETARLRDRSRHLHLARIFIILPSRHGPAPAPAIRRRRPGRRGPVRRGFSGPPPGLLPSALAQPAPASAPALLERGNGAYGRGDLEEAVRSYEACLELDPDLTYCAVNLASALSDSGDPAQLGRAEALYREALRTDPADPDAAFNLAMLLHDRKTVEAAREAAELLGVAVRADPGRWDAWANLASALAEVGDDPLGTVRAYERAILLIEREAEEEEQAGGGGEDAGKDRYLSALYSGYGGVLADLGPSQCLELERDEHSLLIGNERDGDGDGDGEDQAAAAAANAKRLCTETALNALRSAAILDAGNSVAAHMLAALSAADGGDDGVHRRASPEFVATLFDDFADTFDEKLGSLEYRVPGLIGALAAGARGGAGAYRSALDAGCGTGLAGRFLRPLVRGPMVGVDISQKMLDKAAGCTLLKGCGAEGGGSGGGGDDGDAPLYDALVALDLEAMTLEETLLAPGVTRRDALAGGGQEEAGFDLVVAADVLVYFGRLDAVLGSFAGLSATGATLMFTCERTTEEEAPLGYRLHPSGRFSHTKAYVLDTARELGYSLQHYEEIVPRMEKGVEVKGHIFHFTMEDRDAGKEEL